MHVHGRFERNDGEPMGTFDTVRHALRTVFPGLVFEWSSIDPQPLAEEEVQGVALPEHVRRLLADLPPTFGGHTVEASFTALFSLGPSEPVRSVSVGIFGDLTAARPYLETVASCYEWELVLQGVPREQPPAICPRCRSPRMVGLIWDRGFLSRGAETDVAAGGAIVAVPELLPSYEPWRALRRRAGKLPAWACLDCAPGWSEVYQLVERTDRRQVEKEESLAAGQFERAARLRDDQYRELDRWVKAVARMLNEADATGGSPG